MPFVTPSDVGTTERGRLTTRQRLQAWERTEGTCVVCSRQIDGVRERWIVEHIRALELGGADALENLGPAHEGCGRAKTRDDHAQAAEAKRRKARHLGLKTPRTAIPGSRSGPAQAKARRYGRAARPTRAGPARRGAAHSPLSPTPPRPI